MVLSFCFACWRFYSVVLMDIKYSSSTFFLAHGVLLKNFKLDFMLGSLRKHWIGMRLPSSSQSYCSTRRVKIVSSVIPCKGSLDCSFMMFYLFQQYERSERQYFICSQDGRLYLPKQLWMTMPVFGALPPPQM